MRLDLIRATTVFKDAAAPRPAVNNTGTSSDRLHQHYFDHNQMQQMEPGVARTDFAGFTFDGSNFNTEDLGQFWLWNMDPYVDDSNASWHSGEEYAQ